MNKLFAQFLTEYQASPLTKKAYGLSLGLFDRFLAGGEPTERKVEEFMLDMQTRKLSSSTINRHLSAIRAYFLWRRKNAPLKQRYLYDLMVKGPKIHEKLPRVLVGDEVGQLVKVCKNPYEKALVMTLYDGALRVAELMGLDVQDIDYANGVVKITRKGGDERRVPIGDKTLKVLKAYISNRHGKVFPQQYWQLRQDLRKLGKQVGIKDLNPHVLRHSRASDLSADAVPIEAIQELLNHRNINTTRRYIHLQPEQLKKSLSKAF